MSDMRDYQDYAWSWANKTFDLHYIYNKRQRSHRFLEEALELVQAANCSQEDAHQLVDYVYSRPVGDRMQEIGGVMVTLAILCTVHGIKLHEAAHTELFRCWANIDKIRAKQKAKLTDSALPGSA